MDLAVGARSRLAAYLRHYDGLIGDARTRRTFGGVVEGVIGAGSLCCARIAAFSPTLAAAGAAGEKRVRRLVGGESTKRSVLTAEALGGALQGRAVAQLAGSAEVWVALDGSDLRKPYARAMAGLMEVRPLSGAGTVPGYRTLTALGVGDRGRRGVLYHRLFSARAADFVSEPAETRWPSTRGR